MLVFKTVAKAVKLAKAIYLGPNDLTDKDGNVTSTY